MTNIILFLTDDHGAWANGCYGNSEVHTPTLDRLAREGVIFQHAYTPAAVCSPARACLLTGRTPSQVGIHDWLEERDMSIANRDWMHDEKTLFEYLHDAGYYTALSGKWHLGQSHLKPKGVDAYFGLPGWQGDHNDTYTYVLDDQPLTLEGNKSAQITDYALQFIEQAGDKPFFLNIGYIVTHSPWNRQYHRPELVALYENATFRDIPPYQTHAWVKNEGISNMPTPEQLRDVYTGYYAAVTEIDQNIQRIVEYLEQTGRREETIIIYTSDHGLSMGQHGFFGKGNSTRPLNMVETSIHVPLIVSGIGVNAQQARGEYVDHYDTFRTVLDLADIEPDSESATPGRSYQMMLQGETIAWENTLYGEYGDLRMVRDDTWKLVYRFPNGPHDLFNPKDDPQETVNLIRRDELQPVIAELRRRLFAFYAQFDHQEKSGLRVKSLPTHNISSEGWRDGLREGRGLQVYEE